MKKALIANAKDNVATALTDLKEKDTIAIESNSREFNVNLKSSIPFGHKFSVADIKKGEEILKYGETIGIATKNISIGDHVHVHNVESQRGRGDLKK